MKEIYLTDFRENTDIFPECLIPLVAKEKWIFLDTSVLVLLSKIFVDRNLPIQTVSSSVGSFVELLSLDNLNLMHLSIVEGARVDKDLTTRTINHELALKLALGFLRAQCVDLEVFDKRNIRSFVLSNKRIDLMLSEYPYKAGNLETLAKKIVQPLLSERSFVYLDQAKVYEAMMIKPLFELTRKAYQDGKSNYEKIKIFKNGLESYGKYTPKLFDFCMQALLYSEKKDSLMKGAIRKFKKEPEHFGIDLAISEIVTFSNTMEVSKNLTAWNFLATCDKIQFFYSQLGYHLDVKLGSFNLDRIYVPKFSDYQNLDTKTRNLVSTIFHTQTVDVVTEILNTSFNTAMSKSIAKNFKIFRESNQHG